MLSANRFPSPRSNSREPVLRTFVALDATRIEVDPLALLPDGHLAALGASLAADDNALFRQPALPALQAEDAAEQTEGVVPIGEFGGMEAQDAVDFIRDAKPSIPIVAVVVGRTAPSERRRGGHAGALLTRRRDFGGSHDHGACRHGCDHRTRPHLVGATFVQALPTHTRPSFAVV